MSDQQDSSSTDNEDSDEFTIEAGKLQLLLVEPFGRGFGRLQDKFAADPFVQVVLCGNSADAAQMARMVGACVILCYVPTQDLAVKHLAMLKSLAEPIAAGKVRVLMTIAPSAEDLLIDKLRNLGVSELIPEPVPDKSLGFKIDRAIKGLPAYRNLTQQVRAGRGERDSAPVAAPQIRQAPPLPIQSDCWMAQGGGARFIGGRWTVRLVGPGYGAGQWVELDTAGQENRCWQWVPSDPENDPFIFESGAWYFRGKREPELKGTVWWFVGQRPTLEFIIAATPDRPEVRHVRFTVDDSVSLVVAQDPERSPDFLRAIQTSLQKPGAGGAHGSSSSAGGGEAETPLGSLQIKMAPPLELASDFWIYGKGRVKRIGARWAVRLLGPGPSAGRWVQLRTKSTADGEQFWRWKPHDPDKDTFVKEQGSWICRGLQPRFEEDAWLFVSKRPSLSFYHERESYGSKLAADPDGSLVVAQDSEQALNSIDAIRATLQMQIHDADEVAKKGGASQHGDSGDEEAELEQDFVRAPAKPPLAVSADPFAGGGALPSLTDGPRDSIDKIEEIRQQAASTVRPERMGMSSPNGVPTPPKNWTGPEASALAVAFYVSEIIAKRMGTPEQLAERYCRYLASICGGTRFELWFHRDGVWGCAGTSDGAEGRLSELAARALEDPSATTSVPGASPTMSVGVIDSTGRILGAVALEGPLAVRVPVPFAQATAALSAGILRSMNSGAATKTASKPAA